MNMDSKENPKKFDEPSLLDFVKSKIKFWEKSSLNTQDFLVDEITFSPPGESERAEKGGEIGTGDERSKLGSEKANGNFPWSFFIGVILAIIAQILLEPSAERSAIPGIFFYLLTGLALIISFIRKEIPDVIYKTDEFGVVIKPVSASLLAIGLLFEIVAFLLFKNGQFTFINTLLWVSGLVLIIVAFWDGTENWTEFIKNVFRKVKQSSWKINVTRWTLVVVLSILLVLVFRFADLDQVPGEMISDQAERLLAVNDIALGSKPIYSFRNNGSEVLQYYLTEILLKLSNSNVTFFALKTVSVFSGLITVIYMYLLGKEIANKWVGLFSAIFLGIAYWPNVLARSSLGSVFVPLFMTIMLFYLLKGLRESKRNLFLLAGIAFGLGLMSYRVFLIAPLIIFLATGLYCSHEKSKDKRLQAIWGMLIIFLIGVIIYLPLLRVVLNNPEAYLFRIFSRLAEWERPYPGNAWAIFAKNLWAGITMFFWSNGNQWVESVVRRPSLDFISGALFMVGIFLGIVQYIRKRHWMDLFLVLSIIVLLLPSVLSIAFPEENPSLSQASGAIVPTFIIIGLTIYLFLTTIWDKLPKKIGSIVAVSFGLILILLSSLQNYDLVFKQYKQNYLNSAPNISEIANVLEQFNNTSGSFDNAWILGYPHWIDSKLVAITLNEINRDFTIWPESIEQTKINPEAKMFLLNTADDAGKQSIMENYPEGTLWEYSSEQVGKNFLVFFVPPSTGVEQ